MELADSLETIYQYLDYRKFLADRLRFAKLHEKLSLRMFAHNAGFGSHSFLQKVISGERSLSISSVYKITKGLGLNETEGQYLEYLVRFNQSTDNDERNSNYRNMIKIIPKKKIRKIRAEEYEVFANWYTMPIREMVLLPDFKEDPEWIARTLVPNISPKEAAAALDVLLAVNYLRRDAAGRLELAAPFLTTGAEVHSLNVANYHSNMTEVGRKNIQAGPNEWRDISALCFLANREQYLFIKQRLNEARQEIMQYLADSRPAGEAADDPKLYALNLHLINLMRVNWKVPRGKTRPGDRAEE